MQLHFHPHCWILKPPRLPQKKQNLLSFPTVLVPFLFVKITIWMHCNSSLQLGVFIILIQHSVVEKVIKLCLRRSRLNSKSFTELSFSSFHTRHLPKSLNFNLQKQTIPTKPHRNHQTMFYIVYYKCYAKYNTGTRCVSPWFVKIYCTC